MRAGSVGARGESERTFSRRSSESDRDEAEAEAEAAAAAAAEARAEAVAEAEAAMAMVAAAAAAAAAVAATAAAVAKTPPASPSLRRPSLLDEHGSAIPHASATHGGGRLPAAPASVARVGLSTIAPRAPPGLLSGAEAEAGVRRTSSANELSPELDRVSKKENFDAQRRWLDGLLTDSLGQEPLEDLVRPVAGRPMLAQADAQRGGLATELARLASLPPAQQRAEREALPPELRRRSPLAMIPGRRVAPAVQTSRPRPIPLRQIPLGPPQIPGKTLAPPASRSRTCPRSGRPPGPVEQRLPRPT